MSSCCVCMELCTDKAVALINCGHIYHLSCARRWFQTKGKSERGGPAHAPCPKCKQPYDMGSAVTVFMDVPKDERGEVMFSPTPAPAAKSAGRGDGGDPDGAVVPDSPRADPRDGNENTSGGDADADPREVASLRRDLRREQTRAREAEDRLARAEMDAERIPHLLEETERQRVEIARKTASENNALFEARTAKRKCKQATDDLSNRLAEFQRAQSKLQSMETQRRLERDLHEGVSLAEQELLVRFRREDPRHAVETLCRSLAGKNRQLARQIDEYGKLVRRVKTLESGRGVGTAGGGVGPIGGPIGGRSSAPSSPAGRLQNVPEGSKRRAWGADDDDAWDDAAALDADNALRRPLRDAGNGLEKRIGKTKGVGGSSKQGKKHLAFDDHGLGRKPVGNPNKRVKATSGEDLLDDILSGMEGGPKGGSTDGRNGNEKSRGVASAIPAGAASFSRRFGSSAGGSEAAGGGDGGSFVIHGADGRGGRTKVIRTGGFVAASSLHQPS